MHYLRAGFFHAGYYRIEIHILFPYTVQRKGLMARNLLCVE